MEVFLDFFSIFDLLGNGTETNCFGFAALSKYRHVAKSKNLGGQEVMRRAAAARRRLLIRQNLGGQLPPPARDMPEVTKVAVVLHKSYYVMLDATIWLILFF